MVAEVVAEVVAQAVRSAEIIHCWGYQQGVYNLSAGGSTTWYEIVYTIVKAMPAGEVRCKEVLPIPSGEYVTEAKRPLNLVLCNDKLLKTFGLTLPPWQRGLELALELPYKMTIEQIDRPSAVWLHQEPFNEATQRELARRKRFLRNCWLTSGLVFVVVLHLLSQILAWHALNLSMLGSLFVSFEMAWLTAAGYYFYFRVNAK